MRSLVALLLFCSPAWANWPTTAEVGETITFELEDAPTIDVDKTLGEAVADLQKWTQSGQQLVSAPEGATVQLDLSIGLSFTLGASGLSWDASLSFSSDRPGVHVLVFERDRKIQLHRVTVGGEGEPPPVPPPTPTPVAALLVTIVEETSESPVWVTKVLRDPQVMTWIGTKHMVRRVDIDARNEHDKVPDDLLGPFSAASGESLPFLAIQDRATGKVMFSSPLPQNPGELLGILREYSE